MSGLQEFRRRRRLSAAAARRVLVVAGRIMLAASLGYIAAFLAAGLTPIGAASFFLIGPVAAGLALLLGGGGRSAGR